MTKKYTSLEHTIRKIHDKKQIDEAGPLGVAAAVGRGILQAGKWIAQNPVKSAIGAGVLTGGGNTSQGTPSQTTTSKVEPMIQPVAVTASDVTPKSKTRKKEVKEENLEEMGVVGTDKYKGNTRSFYTPLQTIGPGHSQESQRLSGKRRLDKQKGLNRVEESGYAPNQGNAAQVASWPTYEETDRKEVEYVSRPDTAKSPKDKKSKLGRQSAVLTRIIDEEKSLVEFFNVTLKKRKEKKKKQIESESGQTQVVFNPKLVTPKEE